jgi:hypothetical protein
MSRVVQMIERAEDQPVKNAAGYPRSFQGMLWWSSADASQRRRATQLVAACVRREAEDERGQDRVSFSKLNVMSHETGGEVKLRRH